jgi:uncharacterized protein (DUF2147 family)
MKIFSTRRPFERILIFALAFVLGARASAQVKADDITGVWQTHGDKPAKVSISKAGDVYFGKIVSLQYPLENGKPVLDKKNPDKDKQSQPVLGLQILTGFHFDEDEWNKGEIYDPESGKTYSCTISMKDANTLKVRGYIGISLLGRTEVWTRTTIN